MNNNDVLLFHVKQKYIAALIIPHHPDFRRIQRVIHL